MIFDNQNQVVNNGTSADSDVFSEETGDIIFEAALLRFLPSVSEEEAEAFQSYIEANVEKQTFLEDLYRDYPEFGQILEEEMKNLNEDFSSVLKAIETD